VASSPMAVDPWHVLLSAVPLVVLLVGLLGLGWSGTRAGVVALVVAVALAVAAFAMPIGAAVVALWRGVAVSLDVLYIIWAALLLDRLADGAGAIRSIGNTVSRLTDDPVWQLLIIGFAFSSFLQGVAGFGVPVAVTAPLLLGLGFSPLVASAVPLVGHSWSVTLGSMASSFQALRAVTALPPVGLGFWVAILLGIAGVATGFAVAHMHGGWAACRRGFLGILVLGVVMAATQLFLAMTRQWTVSAFAAGMVGLVLSMALARWSRGGRPVANNGAGQGLSPALAFLPYYTLIAVVALATFVAPLHDLLNQRAVPFSFMATDTGRGWHMNAATFRIPPFGHPGGLLLYTVLLTALLFRRRGIALPAWGQVWTGVSRQGLPTTWTLLLLSGVAMVMTYSGMTFLLARGLAGLFGPVFPLISPFIGAVGTVITGSNTSSNLLLGALQRDGARLLGVDAVLIAALQSAGGALGSMLAPAKVVLATATTGIGGQEGRVMRVTLRYAIVLTGGLGIIGLLLTLVGH
jgi:lactate permease